MSIDIKIKVYRKDTIGQKTLLSFRSDDDLEFRLRAAVENGDDYEIGDEGSFTFNPAQRPEPVAQDEIEFEPQESAVSSSDENSDGHQ